MVTRIHIQASNDSFPCADGADVLRAMECLGRKGIPVGCRGGGCGVCKVRVLSGDYATGTMSRACVSEQEQAEGYALACKLVPRTDLRLEVIGKMSRSFVGAAGNFHFYGVATPPRHR